MRKATRTQWIKFSIVTLLYLCLLYTSPPYKGEVDLEGFEAFYKECTHPLFYNGDLHTACLLYTSRCV